MVFLIISRLTRGWDRVQKSRDYLPIYQLEHFLEEVEQVASSRDLEIAMLRRMSLYSLVQVFDKLVEDKHVHDAEDNEESG